MIHQGALQYNLILVYAAVALYALCFTAQAPVLPYITKTLYADAAAYGKLQTVFSGIQLVGGLLAGPLVDRCGGKALMLVSFGASILCYALTAAAGSMQLLYISRIPTLMQHAVLAGRTMATAQTADADRASALGYVGVAYGAGFAVGPVLGGMLSHHNLRAAAWAAAGGSLLGLCLVAAFLPPGKPAKGTMSDDGKTRPAVTLAAIRSVCCMRGVPQLLTCKVIAAFASAIFYSTYTVALQEVYHLDTRQNGLLTSYVGLLMLLGQAVLIQPATKLLGESRATLACCLAMALGFCGISFASSVWLFMAWLTPIMSGAVVLATLNTSQLTKAVPQHMRGTIVSVDMSLGSGLRMISPMLGTAIFTQHGYTAVCSTSGALMAMLLGLVLAVPSMRGAGSAHSTDAVVKPKSS